MMQHVNVVASSPNQMVFDFSAAANLDKTESKSLPLDPKYFSADQTINSSFKFEPEVQLPPADVVYLVTHMASAMVERDAYFEKEVATVKDENVALRRKVAELLRVAEENAFYKQKYEEVMRLKEVQDAQDEQVQTAENDEKVDPTEEESHINMVNDSPFPNGKRLKKKSASCYTLMKKSNTTMKKTVTFPIDSVTAKENHFDQLLIDDNNSNGSSSKKSSIWSIIIKKFPGSKSSKDRKKDPKRLSHNIKFKSDSK